MTTKLQNRASFAAQSCDQVTLINKAQGNDTDTAAALHNIFLTGDCMDDSSGHAVELSNLRDYLDQRLDASSQEGNTTDGCAKCGTPESEADVGRLGPENTVFDYKGNMGTLVIEADRLGLSSQSNFSSIRANVCVWKGRWVYELMLGSRGVMQLGWCTATCGFTQEEGVGDTEDSYAYDGNRQRRWNMKSPSKYGEVWLTGDVISCAIDCDVGTVSFYRNGRFMGEAFTGIHLGPGLAYFPAVSLSLSENVRANFGATPLRYPIEGYRPLQDPPMHDLVRAQHLFEYLEKIVPLLVESNSQTCPGSQDIPSDPTHQRRSHAATLMLISGHVFDKLAPLLKSPYIVEAGLLKFLLPLCQVQNVCGDHVLIQQSLDLIWAFMQESERKQCLDHLMASLISAYRFSPALPDFAYQLTFLVLLFAVLKHERTRKYVIKNVLFDKIRFPTFLHVKPPDDEGLVEIIPEVCLDLGDRCPEKDEVRASQSPSDHTLQQRQKYFGSCKELSKRVSELEYLQVEILKLLLTNNDTTQGGASTRFVFLHKFREFLKENFPPTSRTSALWLNKCPLSVSLCFFHRLVAAIRHYWDELYTDSSTRPGSSSEGRPSEEASIPCKSFFDESINYFDLQRIGGLHSHLAKIYHKEILKLSFGEASPGLSSHLYQIRKLADMEGVKAADDDDQSRREAEQSLIELLDGAILLYSIAAHKQLAKMCSLRDTVHEYVDALEETNRKISACPKQMSEVLAELHRSREVFEEKGTEQVRQMAWVVAVIYAQDKQEDVCWLLKVILRSISRASDSGPLFAFMPDYYVDSCIYAYQALRSFFHPTLQYSELKDFPQIRTQFATFLSEHFADERIINADCKDALVQALACFVCYPHSLKTLESISLESRLKLTRALLAPYENRSWAQTNWILVRLWKGCGFGFRYTQLPHLLALTKSQQPEHVVRKPCPSVTFQEHIAQVLREDNTAATKFIDTVLSQLNWAFSEFIGMLQELQSIAARPSAAFIDSRHLKICATCFDLSVGLLRLLEMIIAIRPELLTDWSKPLAEQLLCRLCQLLSQVLNRITSKSNTFDVVVAASIPGLETVDHFPILGAVCGIMVQLTLKSQRQERDRAVQAILSEPGFQLSCLEFLIGENSGDDPPSETRKPFSLKNYKDNVSDEELSQINQLINMIRTQQQKDQTQATVIDEDSLCEICYARSKSVRFLPCEHQSCKSCIIHQMMNKKECFFCKTSVTEVIDLEPEG